MKEIILLIGLMASGKSTFYKSKFEDTHIRINMDMIGQANQVTLVSQRIDESRDLSCSQLIPSLSNKLDSSIHSYSTDKAISPRNAELALVRACCEHGISLVIDNTNPTAKGRKRFIEIAQQFGYVIKSYVFESDLETCKKRNLQRTRKVPDKAFNWWLSVYEEPMFTEEIDFIYNVKIEEDRYNIVETFETTIE